MPNRRFILSYTTLLLVCLSTCSGPHRPTLVAADSTEDRFQVQREQDRFLILLDNQVITEFVFRDDLIHRPYFANLQLASGHAVTRHHPPIKGTDDTDHDTMHPGIWLGFGDINGHDFWRNKGRMVHDQFVSEPVAAGDRLTFAAESRLIGSDETPLGRISHRWTIQARPVGWMLVWQATIHADDRELVLGDQEEMGFGARMATPLIEKKGGHIVNSAGQQTAAVTWGQAADWCDYSGAVGERSAGIMLMTSKQNFRPSWWHNRDYGLMVANPFGQAAMKQGDKSSVVIATGQQLTLCFGALVHQGQGTDLASEFEFFEQSAAQ